MEQMMKEYFEKLSDEFWQPNSKPKIKRERFEEHEDVSALGFSTVFNELFNVRTVKIENAVLGIDVLKFYDVLVQDEPSIKNFIYIFPLSYHREIIKLFNNPYDVLPLLVKIFNEDWSKKELVDCLMKVRN